ncbi:MAG: PAS domain-containing protein [Acetobacteraceae bacterium]|nr:PAS domain-containing protein [Acetobacteraceae bacterium]
MLADAEETEAVNKAAILVIGASGVETGSLVHVLLDLPLDIDLAVILALQYREALDEDRFRSALAERASALDTVTDGAPITPGRIYLPVLGQTTRVTNGRFRAQSVEQAAGSRGTIDSFFVSLAQDQDGWTIGLVLAGIGTDGTLGVTAIKEAGGLTLAEATRDTEAKALSTSNTAAALVDFVLPLEEIPKRIGFYVRHLTHRQQAEVFDAQAARKADTLMQIAAVLRDRTGHDFHNYKRNTFLRRVQRRMQVVEVDTIEAYFSILRARVDEAKELFNDLLIGVTQFFRDHREFEFLETRVIPQLFEGKTRNDHLRVWVLGCSTGEEAYSLAILLREQAAQRDVVPHMQIFATDIDGRALATGRVGRYPQTIAQDITPQRLARWFVKEDSTYCVVKELREMCVFSQHSLIKDAPFSKLDLISCRNLLIYLDIELQNRIIPLFHFALMPGGFLFLGNAENVSGNTKLFAPIDRGLRVFRRRETGTRVLPDFPVTPGSHRPARPASPSPPRPFERDLARHAARIVERYAPAYAVVDEKSDVLHFSARAGRFIHPASGAASLNLLSLVHNDLRLELRSMLGKAAQENRAIQANGLPVGVNGQRVTVDLAVEPIREDPTTARAFVIIFKDGLALPGVDEVSPDAPVLRDEQVRQLEVELRITRERLHTAVEEFETTNEELKASNEEYQSLNEELQSANEELETSKEEMQSINEELSTVNGELTHRVQELGRVNSDLKNLLESTQIATMFLSNELQVMNYTPAVTEIFHLIETDIGRPIGHIKPRITYNELQDDARRVLRTLNTVEREIENPSTNAHYMVRVLPYRSVDNFIAGVVVTFTDVTQSTNAQRALRESEAALRRLNETLEIRVAERTAELMASEATLAQAQKMEAVGQLTGGIAHDFNNMLQAIFGGLELMRLRIEQGRPAETGRYLDAAYQTVERASALTHRLLAFARRQVLQSRLVAVGTLIEGMADMIRRTVGPAVQLELCLSASLGAVLCDPNQLESVLLNLAINARDAMPKGGRLTIATQAVRLAEIDVDGQEGARPGDYVEIAVSDTGTGMDEATRMRAFEPFFTTKPLGQGTGLGLSQLYGFVRQSDGLVRLDSTLGRGTTVRLYLPHHSSGEEKGLREPETTEADGAERNKSRSDQSEKLQSSTDKVVLVIDDESPVRKMVAEALREIGYHVLEAADGPEALRLLQDHHVWIDLLVTDVGLPRGLNGRQVAEIARERQPKLPVLFITGYASFVLEGQLAPGMEVVGKPFTLDVLAAKVRTILERKLLA